MSVPTRRQLLTIIGAGTLGGIAGCSNSQDSTQANRTETPTSETAQTDPAAFPAFDPADPAFPQQLSTLLEAGFQTGTKDDLKRLRQSDREKARYGDPVPATPDDESTLIEPDTIRFSLAPTEDPQEYGKIFQPLLANIEAETGIPSEYVTLEAYGAQVEAMQAERIHVAGFSTGTVPFAVNIAGAVPFAIQVEGGGQNASFGYRLFVITQLDNTDIQTLPDLAGARVAHTAKESNSGNLAPRALFPEHGVTPGEDYKVIYSGGHQESTLGVVAGDYDVAPVCSTCIARLVNSDEIDPDKLKVIWASRPFPTTGFCYRYTLHPEIQKGIVRAFLEYEYQNTAIPENFNGRGTWVEIEYATVWDIILKIQESIETTYTVGNL